MQQKKLFEKVGYGICYESKMLLVIHNNNNSGKRYYTSTQTTKICR